MYVRVSFEGRGEAVAWLDRELSGLPVESVARRWRQEVYFETPFEVSGDEVLVVERGDVAFWPRGRAMCLFHGYSQPHGPVIKLGVIVGSPDLLSSVEDGAAVRLDPYIDYGRAGEVAKRLRDFGFKAAAHTWEEEERVGVLVEGVGGRVGVEVAVEEDFYVQTQPIAFFDGAPPTVGLVKLLSREIAPTGVRLDLDDEGYLVLTAFFKGFEELVAGLRRLLSTYVFVDHSIVVFYSVRRPA